MCHCSHRAVLTLRVLFSVDTVEWGAPPRVVINKTRIARDFRATAPIHTGLYSDRSYTSLATVRLGVSSDQSPQFHVPQTIHGHAYRGKKHGPRPGLLDVRHRKAAVHARV